MTPMMDVVKQAVQERYPGLPGSTSAAISAGQEQLYSEFKEQKKEGKTSDTGIDLSNCETRNQARTGHFRVIIVPGKDN